MKPLFVPCLLSLLLLNSCGDSSNNKISQEAESADESTKPISRLTSPDAPKLPIKLISSQGWVGNVFAYQNDFIEVFENVELPVVPPPGAGPEYEVKRDQNDTGMVPVSKGRLRFKGDNSPYSGKVFQHYLSGEILHYATYKDGFREGRAFGWKKDGNLTKVSQGWGYNYQEIDLNTILDNPGKELTAQMKVILPELETSAVFIGTQEEWKEWATVNSDGITFCLTTGVYLDGEVKIHAQEGHLDTVRIYKEGLLDGEFSKYHSNGTQSQSIQYKAGQKHGKETWWQDNGYKSYSANFLDGQLHGKTFNWDDNGYLASQSEFDRGKPMRPTEEVTAPVQKIEQ